MIVDTCFLSFVTWIYIYVTLSFEYVTFVKRVWYIAIFLR